MQVETSAEGDAVGTPLGVFAAMHVCEQAIKQETDLSKVAAACHTLYGRGAFFVFYESEVDTVSKQPSNCTSLIQHYVNLALAQQSEPLISWDTLDPEVQEDLLATFIDCPLGNICETVLFRKIDVLVNELGSESQAAQSLRTFDPLTSLCFVGQYRTGADGGVYTDVCTRPLSSVSSLSTIQSGTTVEGALMRRAEEEKKLGSKALQAGRLQNARVHYAEALRMLSHLPDPCTLRQQVEQNLSLCALKEGAWQDCIELCIAILAREGGDSAKVRYRLGLSLSKLASTEGVDQAQRHELYGEAVVHLQTAAALEPSDRIVQQLLEDVRIATGSSAPATGAPSMG